jgi:hypothetical protein
MTETETDPQAEKVICLFPGCEREAVPPPKIDAPGRGGPPPRYCDIEQHNASSTYHELKRLEKEASGHA